MSTQPSSFHLTHATAAFLTAFDAELFCPIRTQQQVARELNISQAAVHRLERSALRKLRAMPEARALLKFARFTPQV